MVLLSASKSGDSLTWTHALCQVQNHSSQGVSQLSYSADKDRSLATYLVLCWVLLGDPEEGQDTIPALEE